jgi:hypothetical protein
MKKHKHRSYAYDWKNKRSWPYKDDILDDPKYIEDRNNLFRENGNGWWWYQGLNLSRPNRKKKENAQVED